MANIKIHMKGPCMTPYYRILRVVLDHPGNCLSQSLTPKRKLCATSLPGNCRSQSFNTPLTKKSFNTQKKISLKIFSFSQVVLSSTLVGERNRSGQARVQVQQRIN